MFMVKREVYEGPWAGLPVTWNDDLSFDEASYRENVKRCCEAQVPGVYTAGTTGEFYAMEFDEWKAVSRATVEQCRKFGTPCMLGITSTHTLGAQRRAEYAVEIGADAVQIALPFWLELNDCEVLNFFRDVARASGPLALSIYETMRAKKALTLEQHKAIKQEVVTYVAVKSNPDTVGCTRQGCVELSKFVNVWVSEHLWTELGPYGANGCASAQVYMNPRVTLLMFDLLKAKKWDELKNWTDILHRYYAECLSPFAKRGFTDSAFDHIHALVAGFLTGSCISRRPYTSATPEDVEQIRKWWQENAPQFLEL